MNTRRICPDCDNTGDATDFADGICGECGGKVVTEKKMNEIKRQYDEVMNRCKKNSSWIDEINNMKDMDV